MLKLSPSHGCSWKWNHKEVMKLVCQKQKLVSASFAKLQIWTERKRHFHEPKIIQWVHAPGLKGLVGRTISRRKHKVIGAKINRVAVEITRLDQNEKEVDPLNFSKEQH